MKNLHVKAAAAFSLFSCERLALAANAGAHDALQPAGIQAQTILELWHLSLAVCSAVFALILLVLMWAILRARRENAHTPAVLPSRVGRRSVPQRWVAVASGTSVVLLIGLVVADVLTDHALSRLPVSNAVRIEMTGHQWWWEAKYDSPHPSALTVANELHIPVGETIVVADVIHSFWVPALHGKQDMLPGQNSNITFRADKPGIYRGQCAEFCGAEHALMAFSIIAEPRAEYNAWVAQQSSNAVEAHDLDQRRGEDVFIAHCASCHTVRGTSAVGQVGPDLTHVMSRRNLASETIENTPDELAAWITDPAGRKPGTMMPATPLSVADLHALLTWLETLK
jgi:cytochrome c oxidase subunit 2